MWGQVKSQIGSLSEYNFVLIKKKIKKKNFLKIKITKLPTIEKVKINFNKWIEIRENLWWGRRVIQEIDNEEEQKLGDDITDFWNFKRKNVELIKMSKVYNNSKE